MVVDSMQRYRLNESFLQSEFVNLQLPTGASVRPMAIVQDEIYIIKNDNGGQYLASNISALIEREAEANTTNVVGQALSFWRTITVPPLPGNTTILDIKVPNLLTVPSVNYVSNCQISVPLCP